ncbi:neuroglian-like [Mytilus trossulus]|uniref:neuroglian-like n=1 Tax=Mytilus trossulus TaxID=6551 RepID=UPI003003BF1D
MNPSFLLRLFADLVFINQNCPPSIKETGVREVYFKEGEKLKLSCVANGVPKPLYRWTKNGKVFNLSRHKGRIALQSNSGTLLMKRTKRRDEGVYQCEAWNIEGVSLSDKITVKKAKLEDFIDTKDVTLKVKRGHSVNISCLVPHSTPKANISWVLWSLIDASVTQVNFDDRRFTQDLEGNLYVTNVKDEDYQNGRLYVCMASNDVAGQTTFSNGTVIKPTGKKDANTFVRPHLMWASPEETIGIMGDPLKLKCIFGGNPSPSMQWSFSNNYNNLLVKNKTGISVDGQELGFNRLQLTDRGKYTCYVDDPTGDRIEHVINLIVKAKPFWLEGGQPSDIHVESRTGTVATFSCKAGGFPTPEISWYINGVSLKESNISAMSENRFQNPNDCTVTITDIRLTDAMVLQCNASNMYGYLFSDFYLNVFEFKQRDT